MELTFKSSELDALSFLTGDAYILLNPRTAGSILDRLLEAGYLVKVAEVGPFVAYSLTPAGKAAVKRALG